MCAEENEYIKKGDNLLEYTNGTYVTAPYDCIITEYSVPNAKDICTSDNYIQISSVEDLYMEINIGEDKIGKISSGQEVSIVVNYDETKEYTGNISKINAIGIHNTGGSTFTAIASIKNDGNLKLGMSATCTITLEKNENIPCIPIEAVQIEDEGRYVNVKSEDGTINKTKIETGVSNADYVQIVSGLSLGDKVVYEKTTLISTNKENTNESNSLMSLFNTNDRGNSFGNNKNSRRGEF